MVSGDSSIEPTRALLLNSTRGFTVPLDIAPLAPVDIIEESEQIGKIALYIMSQG